jgi:hypothetical protein
MTDERGEYIAQAKEKLDLLNAKIIELEAKANEKSGKARREFSAKLTGIRETKDRAERRLQELRLASKPAWEDVKTGLEQAQESVADAIKRASERFQ